MIDDLVISSSSNPAVSSPPLEEAQKQVGEAEAKVIPISEIRSLVGQPLKVTIPGGCIPLDGVREIRSYLQRNRFHSIPELVDPADFEWVWMTKKGTLPKRLGKYLKKQYGTYPSDSLLAEVGAIAKRHTSEGAEEFYFEVTDRIDWSATQMGQASNGSCWWSPDGRNSTMYDTPAIGSYCKKFLKEGHLVVKFFPEDNPLSRCNSKGIGRIFLAIEPEQQEWAMMFNGYWKGQGATLKLTRVFSSFLGLSYKQTYISRANRYYVNNEKGYYLGASDVLSRFPLASAENKVKIPRIVPMTVCGNCNLRFELADAKSFEEGISYCATCWVDLFTSCGYCGTPCRRTSVKEVFKWRSSLSIQILVRYPSATRFWQIQRYTNPIALCLECSSAGNEASCEDCGLHWLIDSLQLGFCPPCYLNNYRECRECLTRTVNADAEGNPLCIRCENAFEEEIRIDHIIISESTDEIIYPQVEPEPEPGSVNFPNGGTLCMCSDCRAAREHEERVFSSTTF